MLEIVGNYPKGQLRYYNNNRHPTSEKFEEIWFAVIDPNKPIPFKTWQEALVALGQPPGRMIDRNEDGEIFKYEIDQQCTYYVRYSDNEVARFYSLRQARLAIGQLVENK